MLAFALALAPAGCGSAAFIQDPQRPALFGEEVDSVVVEPFRVAPNTKTGINEVDQGLFQELLSEEIRKRQRAEAAARKQREQAQRLAREESAKAAVEEAEEKGKNEGPAPEPEADNKDENEAPPAS